MHPINFFKGKKEFYSKLLENFSSSRGEVLAFNYIKKFHGSWTFMHVYTTAVCIAAVQLDTIIAMMS